MSDLNLDSSNVESCKLLKVVFVGDSGVGKTCIIERLFSDKFDRHAPATIGTDIRSKCLKVDNKTINVTLWDTAGQERYQSVTAQHYRGAHGVVFVYDVTQADSLDSLVHKWISDFEIHGRPDAIRMIVANKTDLASERQVSPEKGAAVATERKCMYHETSALLDAGIYDALVWGMVCNILDTPGLTSNKDDDTLSLDSQDHVQICNRRRKRDACC